jgi:hypothetical protein
MKQEWCLQCGEENRPKKAIGKDLDGEPACRMHMVAPPVVIPPVKLEPVKPAKAATQPETSEAMATSSKGIKPRSRCSICGREIANFMMGKHMLSKHGEAAKSSKVAGLKQSAAPVFAHTARAWDKASALADLKCKLLADLAAVEAVERLLQIKEPGDTGRGRQKR